MKFTCDKYELQQAVTICSRAAAVKSPVPALEGILITAGDNLRLTGYDLKEGIYTDIDADVAEYGSIVVNARLFGEMIRKMPDGTVSFSADEKDNVFLKCGKNEYKFMGISTQDYPEIPAIDRINSMTVPMAILKSMINQTIFAVATTDVRPVYTGALFEAEEKHLTIVAVDGYRLARRSETLENSKIDSCTFIVPADCLSDIERICTDEEGDADICVGKKHISFTLGNTVVVSRKLEGEFLNYRKSIPTEFAHMILVNKSDFVNSIERVGLIISEKNNSPVRMTFNDGKINLRCVNPVGNAEDECPCEGSGDGMEIGFNNRYMTDALKASGEEKLYVCINNPSSPCIIKAEDQTDKFTYMILPVRLKA
ncbi:MAG: DNA polymerase III subunit beta [Eubacteriales bacterium]|nr:DNA polymerase III subunit beta [Eubacteriales bacterium]